MRPIFTSVSALAILSLAGPAFSKDLNIVTDIAPVQSLVAQVTGDLATPDVILPPGASPHGYAMRPSEARNLQQADVVFWIGEDLTPWLEGAVDTLAASATSVELLELDGTERLEYRDLEDFAKAEAHDEHKEHGHEDHAEHGHDEHKEHGHDDHADHGHDEHKEHGHEDHADHGHDEHKEHGHEDHAGHEGHDHGHHHDGDDPHAWLSIDNAKLWLGVIADTLGAADPDNADTYLANAAAAREKLGALEAELTAELSDVRGRPFLVYHDAYQYFETSFGISASGALADGDAASPSAARIAQLRDLVEDEGIKCVFSEPQFSPNLVTALQDGTGLNPVSLDPLGSTLTAGPDLYGQVLRDIAGNLAGCLRTGS